MTVESLYENFKKNPYDPERAARLDNFVRADKEKVIRACQKILMVGNMQVDHVDPEVTHADLPLMFGTEAFYRACPWARYDPKVFEFVRKEFSRLGLLLIGDTGAGKTTFCKATAFDLIFSGGTSALNDADLVKVVKFGKLMNALSKDDWKYKHYILGKLSQAKTLIIDDLGAEHHQGWSEQILFEIIDNRYHKMIGNTSKKTFFTSNLSVKDLPYNDRLKRRIEEVAQTVQLGWKRVA